MNDITARSAAQAWSFVPHQHRGPEGQTGAEDHIRSPKKHNGAFKAGGIVTFMGAPYCVPDRRAIREVGAKVCFLGVPYDHGCLSRHGTSQGPEALRQASTQYFPYMFDYDVDILTFFRVVDCGDIPNVAGNNERSQEYIYEYVTECLEGGASVILCGGDHSVPIPGARAVSHYYRSGTMGYVHIDCHLDSVPDWGGILITNGSGVSRLLDLPNCGAKNIVHIGSRNGLNAKDWMDFFIDNNIRCIPMREVLEKGLVPSFHEAFRIARNGTDGFYCSWDTDSLDASCMPGTSAPECFGIKSREAIAIARMLGEYGCDVLEFAELAPPFDVSQMSAKMVCCLAYHYLGSRAKTLRAREAGVRAKQTARQRSQQLREREIVR
ncbi:MAG TPA: agmatinase family protein [Alphaproteobacteria bacterium]|nr:agmatinase family protein [Alphaproteobacteria bacterium]